jgi:hypothetical protein
MFDGQVKMYLNAGFEKFARAHNLKVGCMMHCLYKGDGNMSFMVFDYSSCRRHYHSDDSVKDNTNINMAAVGSRVFLLCNNDGKHQLRPLV